MIQHSQETFEGNNGIHLFSQSWVPQGPKKATLIIVHGLHDHSSRYGWVAEELANQGYAVYGFDLRGHGKSDGTRQRIDSSDDYLEDLGRFVNLVQGKEPGRPLFLFGFSMGGNIVASYVFKDRTGIDGAIVGAPGLKPPPSTSRAYISIGKVLGRLFPNMGAIRIDPEDFSRDPNVVAEIKTDPLISWQPTPARTALWILRTGERLREEAGKFDIPFLVLQGTADRLVDLEGNKSFHDRSHSQDKSLKLYEGLYHDILHEPEKQTVLNDMSEWLGKHS